MRRHIEIIGNLTNDATVYTPQNGTGNRVCINFNVAVNEKFKDKQGNVTEKAYFFACALWKDKDNTKVADYLKKGILVFVEGLPEAHVYQDKQGTHIPQLKIDVKDVRLLSMKKDNNGTNNTNTTDGNDDLPF